MDSFVRYVVNTVHCLKWCTVWATCNKTKKGQLKAKLIDAKLEKIGSPSAKDRTKANREYEETVTA